MSYVHADTDDNSSPDIRPGSLKSGPEWDTMTDSHMYRQFVWNLSVSVNIYICPVFSLLNVLEARVC